MPTRFWNQWVFWRNALVIVVALVLGGIFGSFRIKSIADTNIAENRQLKLQQKSLQEQLADHKTLEQVQEETIIELRAANEELQQQLVRLQQDLQQYREVLK